MYTSTTHQDLPLQRPLPPHPLMNMPHCTHTFGVTCSVVGVGALESLVWPPALAACPGLAWTPGEASGQGLTYPYSISDRHSVRCFRLASLNAAAGLALTWPIQAGFWMGRCAGKPRRQAGKLRDSSVKVTSYMHLSLMPCILEDWIRLQLSLVKAHVSVRSMCIQNMAALPYTRSSATFQLQTFPVQQYSSVIQIQICT